MTEEEKINIKEQFNYIVKDGISPILKSVGFRKKGNNIQKDRRGFDGYFNTWKSTINIGVAWSDYAICLYVLCLATGKAKKAKLLRRKMERRKVNDSLLDKIVETYGKRSPETDRFL